MYLIKITPVHFVGNPVFFFFFFLTMHHLISPDSKENESSVYTKASMSGKKGETVSGLCDVHENNCCGGGVRWACVCYGLLWMSCPDLSPGWGSGRVLDGQ